MLKLTYDKSILERAKTDDEMALLHLATDFSPVIRSISKSYFIYGGDSDDIYQLGLIGFYEAVKKFDFSKNTDFVKFAKICIHSKILDAIKEANRKKHSPLNTAVGIDNVDATGSIDPEQRFLIREQLLSVYAAIDVKLSDYEKQVLNLYTDGMSYSEIADITDKDIKSVGNAISRIRKKLVKCPES